jgi:hypothetical protein
MSAPNIVGIKTNRAEKNSATKPRILLVKPPYFTPWTPPLGIAILKSFLEHRGYFVRCFDFNTDPELWGMHHKYFALLQGAEGVSISDGYSKLWWILNAHMLSHANGASAAQCKEVLEIVAPLYGVRPDADILDSLIALVDRFYKRLAELTDRFDLADYGAAGTSTYTTSLGPSLFFLRRIKQKYPHIRTVMGGGVFADDLALESDNLDTLVNEYPYIDHVALGEGELIFLKLLEGELSNKRVISIADLHGSTLSMSDVPSPDFSDLNLKNYYHLTIEGARSCPFQCSFCSETIQWGDYRKKPIDQLVQQVIDLSERYRNNSFFMGDSLMNPYIFQFSSGLLERNARVLYDGYLRADKPVAFRDKVKVWARSGFYRARLGIESASANVLNAMDKMTSPKTISDALKSLANAGIRTTTYWIVGFPKETRDDFRETLDFIREHHRYIYELEAHPYYYYPYGQIGSRLHKCYSLYPEEVTRHTRFKVWEIIDADPSREERYERLLQISRLASELGLPNIYTMAERFQAEDRWHRLWPLAIEVYENTRVSRSMTQLPKRPLKVFSDEWAGRGDADESSVWCYSARVTKELNQDALLRSVGHLIDNNEMLRMSLEDGHYVAAPDTVTHGNVLLAHEYDEEEQDLGLVKGRVMSRLSADMRPERGASIRVALLKSRRGDNHVLLMAHRAMCDSRGVILLFEDLFRIYEQVANQSEISLHPVEKTYEQFINEVTSHGAAIPEPESSATGRQSARQNPASRDEAVVALTVQVERGLRDRLFATSIREYDLEPHEAIAAAVVNSLSRSACGENVRLHVTRDYRQLVPGLGRVVAALTRIDELPAGLADCDDLPLALRRVREAMRGAGTGYADEAASKSDQPVLEHVRSLLRLDYFLEAPWLGGDEWVPEGFVTDKNGPRAGFSLEAIPVMSGDTVEIFFNCRGPALAREIVEELAQNFTGELDLILSHCENYVAAKRFWLKAFGGYSPGPNFFVANDERAPGAGGIGFIPCEFDASLLNKAQSECDADLSVILLAAYAICISRLTNREDLTLITSVRREAASYDVPLRVRVPWSFTFRELARAVRQSLELARGHNAYAFEILIGELPAEQGCPPPVFDVKYIFREATCGGDVPSAEESLAADSQTNQQPNLALMASMIDDQLQLQFVYDKSAFSEVDIAALSTCLHSSLKTAASNTNIRIAEIELGHDAENQAALEALTSETFDFI